MAISITDYLIDQDGIDWSAALSSWGWLLPADFTVWLVNLFADIVLVQPDGSVHILDVGAGTLSRVAESRDDFCNKIDTGDNAATWFMFPLVDRLVAAGLVLQAGQCYGFKLSPVLGGEYTVENCVPMAVSECLSASGRLHEQLRDVPEGSQVRLKINENP